METPHCRGIASTIIGRCSMTTLFCVTTSALRPIHSIPSEGALEVI
jgi:hypothetical protein